MSVPQDALADNNPWDFCGFDGGELWEWLDGCPVARALPGKFKQ